MEQWRRAWGQGGEATGHQRCRFSFERDALFQPPAHTGTAYRLHKSGWMASESRSVRTAEEDAHEEEDPEKKGTDIEGKEGRGIRVSVKSRSRITHTP